MTRLCPACGGRGSKKYSSNINEEKFTPTTYASRKSPELMHHALFQCENCSSLFVEVLPNSDELIRNYVDASFDSQVESEFAAKTYCRYLDKLNLICGNRILDIGCGDGAFIKLALVLGADSVQGIEPSVGALTSAGKMMDMIRAESVVCHDRLSLVNRLLGRKSPIFDIEHLQMFSSQGLDSLIRNAGLEIVYSKQIVNRYPLGYWLRLIPLPGSLRKLIEQNRRSRFLSLPISLMVGNRLVVAKKLSQAT
jgi:hypothetical protein